ncbi:MAG TPA: Lrp/AsnC family transcriptional regulator [Alphaproteobacteria bacterium]|nr:Lrp/AsnC family transcriptional regulator [Alphaproteobacteria bacterium]
MKKVTKRRAVAEPAPVTLDAIDRKILDALQEDNQVTNLELATRVGLSPPPCLRRVRRLRDAGVIARDVSIIDPAKVGHKIIAFVGVELERQREDALHAFERKIAEAPEVQQCYFVSGDNDYLLVVTCTDMDAYNDFCRRVLADDHNIRRFRTSFNLSRVKYDTRIPLE